MLVRRLIVILAALLLAAQVVRNSAAVALSTLHPDAAARLWAAHPSVEISQGLAQIGRASRERRPVDQSTFALIYGAATESPLSPEPFLVRGVQANMSGDTEAARRALLAAQWRDPRSVPAAYFLAEHYLRTGQALQGLEQTALLTRLSPSGGAVTPFIAAYAQNRSNWPQMRALFRSQAGLEDPVLQALAADPRNVDSILAVADADHRKPGSPWLPTLLQSLVASGDYGRARSIWSSVGRGDGGNRLLYDAAFSSPAPPPPFNWTLASSTVGLAERQPGRRLHLIFYGNEDGVLASELLLLPPGAYRLQMRLAGSPVHPETLRWSVRCDKSPEPFASAGIGDAASRGWSFEVPANCPAQWLELSGRSGDVAQQSEATITALSLAPVPAKG
ncbi:MAG TPA: hypothetical protein VFW35_02510 [Sphingomicrobium sp.]|nr:hypothetical protein [Sphingomicrobium sp.]